MKKLIALAMLAMLPVLGLVGCAKKCPDCVCQAPSSSVLQPSGSNTVAAPARRSYIK